MAFSLNVVNSGVNLELTRVVGGIAPTGATGFAGSSGYIGVTGSTGPQGLQGATGTQGSDTGYDTSAPPVPSGTMFSSLDFLDGSTVPGGMNTVYEKKIDLGANWNSALVAVPYIGSSNGPSEIQNMFDLSRESFTQGFRFFVTTDYQQAKILQTSFRQVDPDNTVVYLPSMIYKTYAEMPNSGQGRWLVGGNTDFSNGGYASIFNFSIYSNLQSVYLENQYLVFKFRKVNGTAGAFTTIPVYFHGLS